MDIPAEGSPAVGDHLCLYDPAGKAIAAEVVGFTADNLVLAPLSPLGSVSNRTPVQIKTHTSMLERSMLDPEPLLSRVVDGLGEAIDGLGNIHFDARKRSILLDDSQPLQRQAITEPFQTGIRAIDSLLTVGKGQRMGIFSGSGVGKSTLLAALAENSQSDINIIALIGERSREIKEFAEIKLSAESRAKTIIVASAASDQPIKKIRAAYTALGYAKYFCSQGKDVLFLADSFTRLAHAKRELGIALGEPPVARGYPPSALVLLSELVEKTGPARSGSITAFCNILVEGDDFDEPVSDSMRGILDGHIMLSRKIAESGQYPAIDMSASISRLMPDIVSTEHLEAALKLKNLIHSYRENEELITIGAYTKGLNHVSDEAIRLKPLWQAFLQQNLLSGQKISFKDSLQSLFSLNDNIK